MESASSETLKCVAMKRMKYECQESKNDIIPLQSSFFIWCFLYIFFQYLSINFYFIKVSKGWGSISKCYPAYLNWRKRNSAVTQAPKLKHLATKRPLLLLARNWLMEQELIPELLMIWLSPIFKGDSTEPSSHQLAHFFFHQWLMTLWLDRTSLQLLSAESFVSLGMHFYFYLLPKK